MRFFSETTRRNNKITLFTAISFTSKVFDSGSQPISIRPTSGDHVSSIRGVHAAVALCLLLSLALPQNVSASIFDNYGEYRALNVFPSEISATSWQNIESLYSQDLDENALYQEFNKNNSAYLGMEDVVEAPKSVSKPSEESTLTEPQIEASTTTSNSTEETGVVDENVLETVPTEEALPEPEESPEEPEFDESALPEEAQQSEEQTVGRVVTQKFALLLSRALERFPWVLGEATSTEELPEIVGEAVAPEPVEQEDVQEIREPEVEVVLEPEVASVATTSVAATSTDQAEVEEQNVAQSVGKRDAPNVPNDIYFSGFAIPDLERGELIDNAQVRLSFGAQSEDIASGTEPAELTVEYTFGKEWESAGVITIVGEASNALNGGYFLFALPTPHRVDALQDLTVRISYKGDTEDLSEVYLDSLWIEIDTKTFDRSLFRDRLRSDVQKYLRIPRIHELLSERLDFTRSELPTFTLRYQPQRNAVVRLFRSLFSSDLAQIRSVTFNHEFLGPISLQPRINMTADGLWTIQITEEDKKQLRPGRYSVGLTIAEGGVTFEDSFDFQWGLLSINPLQSTYTFEDTAEIHMGALSPSGNTLCDADLRLYVIDPDGFIDQADVALSGECHGNNVTDVPDYSATYQVKGAGEYEMYLEHVNENGEVIAHTSDTFLVVPNQTYALERNGPTRIYPLALYTNELYVHAKRESFSGILTEQVPKGFVISDTTAAIREYDTHTELSWNISLLASTTESVAYTFDAPDISPYLYELGPAILTSNSTSASSSDSVVFEEHRQWQIASDAPPNSPPNLAETPAFDNILATTTTPTLGGFAATDPDGDVLEYEFSIDDDFDFSSPATTTLSGNFPNDAGWSAATFSSGATTTYTIQSADALSNGTTYWWRVRARDPFGDNTFTTYTAPRSITIDTSLNPPVAEWYQTLGLQFEDGTLSNTATTTGGVEIAVLGIPVSTTTDSFESVGDGSTDFSSTALWKQASITTDDGEWQGETGATGSGGTGPDEASDGTVFIYTEASNNQQCDNTAPQADDCVIEADIVDGTIESIRFDYHMFGGNLGTLSLDLYNGSSWATVWSRTGQQSADELDWQDSGYIDLSGNKATTTVLRFYANGNGGGFQGDFALDNIRVATSTPTAGTIMSPEVDFDWVPNEIDWGEVQWSVTEPAGTDTYLRVYYTNVTACDTLIPDGDLSGNSAGFDASESGLNISLLSTSTYNRICLEMTLDHALATTSPTLNDWTVSWVLPNQEPEIPTLTEAPAFDSLLATTTPELGGFVTTDFEGDALEYEFSIDNNFDFSSPATTTFSSNYPNDAGWTSSTFASGATTTYTIQPGDALTDGVTYWWRVRARDPSGSNEWSEYSGAWSVTISSTTEKLAWHQTLGLQFERGALTNAATTTDGVEASGGGGGTSTVALLGSWATPEEDDSLNYTAPAGTDRVNVAIISNESGGAAFTSMTGCTGNMVRIDTGAAGNNAITAFYEVIGSSTTTTNCTLTGTASGEANIIITAATYENVVQTEGADDASGPTLAVYSSVNGGENNAPSGDVITLTGTPATPEGGLVIYGQNVNVTGGSIDEPAGFLEQTDTGGGSNTTGTGHRSTTTESNSVPVAISEAGGPNRWNAVAFALTPTASAASLGTVMSPEIDFDWVSNEVDWGTVSWSVTEPAGTDSLLRIYYSSSTACDTLVPDGALPGNSTGLDVSASELFITDLATSTYNRICINVTLDLGTGTTSPTLEEWTVHWDVPEQSPGAPTLADTPAFEYMRSTTTEPVFGGFFASDYENDLMEYELVIDDDVDFSSPATTTRSANYPGDSGWTAATFASGATTTYIIQPSDALTLGETYWWRMRARDPGGSNIWSPYSEARSMTISNAITVPEWFQTTDEQFATGTILTSATTTGDDSIAIDVAGASTSAVSLLDAWSTGNTKTISAGTDRLLVVAIHSEDSGTSVNVDQVTYGGVTLSEIDDQQVGTGYSNGMWLGYLTEAGIAGASGTTITPTWIGGTPDESVLYSSVVYESVNQTTPVRDNSGNTATNVSTITPANPVTVVDGDMMIYAVTSGAQGETHDPPTGYTEGTEEDSGGVGQVAANAYMAITSDGTEQPTANWFNSNNRLTMIAASLSPVTSGGSASAVSSEIDFDWVPDQNTWGEIVWHTTEPAGSSMSLQVYYATSSNCDILVPDGALAGNSTGFAATSSPLDISGLATSTYNRICLGMTLNQGGALSSPELLDWDVSWVRKSVFEQTAYHWYANEDAITPTDTWPPGAGETELSENQPITTEDPVGSGDVLRLRIALGVSSVDATSGSFKLQYAEGESCDVGLSWFDVGDTGSTTALWRGYNNPSVADATVLPSTLLTASDIEETYEEHNDTFSLINTISIGDEGEWDFVVQNNTASAGFSYCFRMVKNDGTILNTYTNYPLLITNAAPNTPTLYVPFNNEKVASTTPWFEFTAFETEGEDLDYEIEIDDDMNFGSPLIDTNTEINLTDFENLITPADKAPYIHNQRIRFIPATVLSNGTTYWWRVRAKDSNGSNEWSSWSSLYSLTIDTTVIVSTWFQTTEEQFDTDTLELTDATGSDLVTLATGSTTGTTTSSSIDFDNATIGNAWGELSWNDTEPPGDILYHLEYFDGDGWSIIPDTDLSGNVAGFDTSPVDLLDLNTVTYNIIRIRANFTDSGGPPTLNDWTLEWGERVSVPTHISLFDNEATPTTTPSFTFFTTDPQGEDLEYEFSWSTSTDFTASTTRNSSTSPGFVNTESGGDTDPFNSGDVILYTIQPGDALTASTTYWWRVRAKDPTGSDSYSFWSNPWSFTTDASVVASTWYQTTDEQFETGQLFSAVTTADSVEVDGAAGTVALLGSWSTPEQDASISHSAPPGTNRVNVLYVSNESGGAAFTAATGCTGNMVRVDIASYGNNAITAFYEAIGTSVSTTTCTLTASGATSNFSIITAATYENVVQTEGADDAFGSTLAVYNTVEGGENNAPSGDTVTLTGSPATPEGGLVIYGMNVNVTGGSIDEPPGFIEQTDLGGGSNTTGTGHSSTTAQSDSVAVAISEAGGPNRWQAIAFALNPTAGGATSGTIISPAIDFDDGSGPSWEQVYWSDTEPGGSTILYQVEYLTSGGTWTLIPDGQIPGNSVGTSTAPINIKFLNTSTYNEIRIVGSFTCGASCPALLDWTVEWSEGIDISGTAFQYDQVSSSTSGTVAVAVNGTLQIGKTGTISNGSWQIDNVTMFPNDIITIFVTGVSDANEAVAVTKYDGVPEMTGVELYERHLSIGSDDLATISNADLALYDFTNTEDLFFDVDGGNDLLVCATTGCSDAELLILANNTYQPGTGGAVTTHDIEINGSFLPGANTVRVGGSWDNNGTFTAGGEAVIFTATSTTESIDSTGASTASFNNLTLGETSGSATWQLGSALDINGATNITFGTLNQNGANAITLAGDLTIGASGLFSKGTATTTFDKAGAQTWVDNSSPKQDLGIVVIDGATTTLQLGSNVALTNLTIGANDIFNVTGGSYDITVYGSWTNNNTFTSHSGEVIFAGTSAHTIDVGASSFYDLTFNGVSGSWSFSEPILTISNNLTIATGTLTMPTGTTTLVGSFTNSGGIFAHNNSVIDFTSTGAETVTQNGGVFTNAFYNVRFNGSGGSWTFTDTNATTSSDLRIKQGTVTLPSGTMTIGGSFLNTGGSFAHNNGILKFTGSAAEVIDTTTSFNDLHFAGSGSWAFVDSSLTALGDVTVSSGVLTLPTNTLSIGGSLTNNSSIAHNNGTVLFDSSDTGETIDTGSSSLYNMVFNSAAGGWTITENATSTNNTTLTALSDLTLASGRILSVGGTFTNSVGGASTTWSGSTLSLESGAYSINTKTDSGDQYDTLVVAANTDIGMWNSAATTTAVDSSGSLYSQDHAGTNGDLYIYGSYTRSSGSEYWSYATDFDGTDLATTSSERQVDVRFASGASASISDSFFEILGGVGATTTIANQGSGTYTVSITNGTTTFTYYDFADLGASGVTLSGTPSVTSLSDGAYEPAVAAGTGITVSSTTINANPGKQIFRVGFATTTAIAAYNVSQTDGTSTSYWWFRNAHGNLQGEGKDNDTGDPGSIRWDDSALVITASGTVYADDGVTPLGAPTCNGVDPNVRVVVNGGTSYTGSCDSSTGNYSISGVTIVGDPVLTVYLDTDGGARGAVISKTPTADITDLDIYRNRIIVRHEDTEALTIEDLAIYDSADDSDLRFDAATGTTDTLTLFSGNELHVWASKTFTPGGDVTINGNASSTLYDGSLHIDDGATFTGSGTSTYSIAGSFTMDTGADFAAASSTVVMNATTTGKTVTTVASQEIVFNELTFTGVSGGWNISGDIRALSDIEAATGTVTGTGNVTLTGGSFYGNGLVSLNGGTTTIETTNTLGGAQGWTFYDLTLGSGSVVGTTTPAGTATTTVLGVLTINTAHFLDAGNSNWDLRGTGDVFVEDGTFLEDTSTVRYSGSGTANILSTNYYDLDLNGSAGTPTYTATGLGIIVSNDLTVGGEASTTATFTTNDPALQVDGDVLIKGNGILIESDSASFTVGGSWDNNGTFAGSGGTVTFNSGDAFSIAAGNSSFSSVLINGAGAATVSENATATAAWTLAATSDFTLSSGNVLAVGGTFTNGAGGAATTWIGSILYLYGGNNYEINTSTTNDIYATLLIGSDTDIRMWNSDAATTTVSGSGSLYSQDHANVNGDLYIYGNYPGNGGTDHWSYATDFDGTALGGSSRKADVYFASGASAILTSGGLSVIGDSAASTTLQNQGSGTYTLRIGGNASTSWSYYEVRDSDSSGLTFSSTSNVVTLSYGDIVVSEASGTGMTVGGSVIDNNPAKTFTQNRFATTTAIGAFNVTATGTSVSSWRFTNHVGNLAGEEKDVDPGGDPGYIVWDDSAATISISGNVYSDEGSSVSTVCDSSTLNILLQVAGLTTYTTSCNGDGGGGGTGFYSFSGVSYSPGDSLVVYISGESEKAANVTVDPVSSIGNMHLYENRVIIRHESTNPITIADMAVWDSSDDADIPFTAVDSVPDTLTLPADRKLIVWTNKEFAPGGNVTLSGGGAGTAYDGTLELYTGADLTAANGESHSVGGSMLMSSGATFDAQQSTTTFTTTGAARTVDTNEDAFYNLTFNGSGSWNITNADLIVGNDITITSGGVTLPSGTTTVSGSFDNTGGSFNANGGQVLFNSSSAENIRTGGSDFGTTTFDGTGSWTYQDSNATTTADLTILSGTVVAPTGVLSVGGNFIANSGSNFSHNSGVLRLTSGVASTSLTLSGEDLFGLTFDAAGSFVMTDGSLAVLDDLTITQGTVTFATGTLSIGGSLQSNGTFNHASGTVLFNAGTAGHTVDVGGNDLYNVVFAGTGGGWTVLTSATTTGNLSITNASSFTQQSGTTLRIEGVFTNTVGGSATTWSGTTVSLQSGTGYTINTKAAGADQYNTLIIGPDTDIRTWNSAATTTIVDPSGSLYSQDHAGVNGALYIYGDYIRSVGTDYWSYATDFDGTALGGSPRAVTVYMATSATTTLSGGTLQMLGDGSGTTTITNQGSGTYALTVTGGTLNALNYAVRNINGDGFNLQGTSTITSLSNGDFELAVDSGSLITLSSTTLNANASKIISGVRFATTTAIGGTNVELVGSTASVWTFTDHRGNLDGEAYDIDGGDDCGSVRWSDSDCQVSEQTHYRWRVDNGGEGVPNTEWYSAGWNKRKRVSITNNDTSTYSDAVVEMTVTYDSDMQSDFDDLRFTESDGTTLISHWIETVNASTDAVVWVKIPSLAAEADTEVYMYYNNATATDASATSTFLVLDDFEDGNISEYSGDTSLFNVGTAFNYERTYGLDNNGNESAKATDGIYRTDVTVSQGETIRYLQYVDTTAGSGDEPCTLFGIQSPGSNNQNYAVCLEQFGTDRVSLSQDVSSNDSDGPATVLASSTITYVTGWHEVEIGWQTDNTIDVTVSRSGSVVATTSVTDSTYTSGGIGFTYWFHNGGWDIYSSRPYLLTEPGITFGAEQVPNGASWAAALDTAYTGVSTNDTARVRFVFENSGLPVTDQEFLLEYAAKGAAPSCEAISAASYASVPPQASCSGSPVCTQTSTYYTNKSPTTDLLGVSGKTFVAGEIIESPSNQTNVIDVSTDEYTELEYAVTVTNDATDENYCFRVTDNGTDFDSYINIAELGLRFDPIISTWTLNNGEDIILTMGATTTISATGTIYDQNGYTDLNLATSTIYRSGVSEGCTPDDNNCYRSTAPQCAFSECSGNSCTLSCTADIYYFADPTDIGTYAGETWRAFVEVDDDSGGTASGTAPSVDLLTLRAITVNNSIDYGALEVNANTGAFNPTTTVENIGNDTIDVSLDGTDLSDGVSSVIPVTTQRYATSTFTYAACTSCSTLSTTTASYEVDLTKPTSTTPAISDILYWGISVPFGANSAAHGGVVHFGAIAD